MPYIELNDDVGKPFRWGMPYSYCRSDGAIISFVRQFADQIDPAKRVVVPACDGVACEDDPEMMSEFPTWRLDYAYPLSPQLTQLNDVQPDMIGVLCSRNYSDKRDVLLPLDDHTFQYGLSIPQVPWESKLPIAFWRGGTSGRPFVRKALVEICMKNPHTDVKFVGHYGSRGLSSALFGEEVGIDTFVKHKYIFVVDGAVISSSHQWVFGSGSVPILITHPLNKFWFKKHLKPFHNYVPISYSLQELDAVLQWLRDNDDKAREIADNAKRLADTIFTPSFQQQYLQEEMERVLTQ